MIDVPLLEANAACVKSSRVDNIGPRAVPASCQLLSGCWNLSFNSPCLFK
jgi:hypothetical protein